MGYYTTYTVDGTIKPQYREKFKKLFELHESSPMTSLEDDVHTIGFDLLYELATGERASAFIYAGWNGSPYTSFNATTGEWSMITELKDYSENVDPNDYDSPEKPKKSSDLFKDLIPTIFEEENFELTEQGEQEPIAREYILSNGSLVFNNKAEYNKAVEEYMGW